MAEVERRHRDRTRQERDHRKRDDHRRRQRSRSPHQRHEGHHRDRDSHHDDQRRGGAVDRHRHEYSHESHQRERESRAMDHDRQSGGERERRYEASDDRRSRRERGTREEKFHPPESIRNGRPTSSGDTGRQVREGERERERGPRPDERQRHPRRERNEEEDISSYEYGGSKAKSKEGGVEGEEGDKEEAATSLEPNYGLSGKLTAETNTYRGVVIKYNEPEEARVPRIRWRLYPFKGDEVLPTLYIHRQSAYLIGRDRKICDMPVDHPSCSKQHAVIQYRLVNYTKADGSQGRRVRPYVIDLESTNGTYVNNQRIEPARYYELKEKDMLKFGFSSREYIILHENSKGDEDDDPMSDGEGGGGPIASKDGASRAEDSGSGDSGNESSSENEKKQKKKKKKSHKSKKK